MKLRILIITIILSNVVVAEESIDRAKRIFNRLTGTPLKVSDPRRAEMASLIESGKMTDAAKVATSDPHFYSVTVKDFAAQMANRDLTPIVELDDFQAMFVGITRDEKDARLLMSGNFRYQGNLDLSAPSISNNFHYAALEQKKDWITELKYHEPQWEKIPEAAGVLTSRAWAMAHLNMGTNRRAVEYAMQEFLCRPIDSWKDAGLPGGRIRQDITRSPGGDPMRFQTFCLDCHAPLDGLSGAFARFDFFQGRVVYFGPSGISPKMVQNADAYPPGFETHDSSWINLATQHHNITFGWRGPLEGNGVQTFGAMLANSRAFTECLGEKAFLKVCRRELSSSEKKEILPGWASSFEKNGYKLRHLFETVATYEGC